MLIMVSVKQYIDFNYYSIFIIAFYFYFLLQGLLCSHSWIARHWESLLASVSSSLKHVIILVGFLGDAMVKQMQETWVWSLGREDPLKEEMATCSSILVWKIPWTEESGRLQSKKSQWVANHWSSLAEETAAHLYAKEIYLFMYYIF